MKMSNKGYEEINSAYENGMPIQEYSEIRKRWEDWKPGPYGRAEFSYMYRINPKCPEYRPHENRKEVLQAIKQHSDWVIWKSERETYRRIITVSNNSVTFAGMTGELTMGGALQVAIWADDGTPFGIPNNDKTSPTRPEMFMIMENRTRTNKRPVFYGTSEECEIWMSKYTHPLNNNSKVRVSNDPTDATHRGKPYAYTIIKDED